jgi:putative transposase
VKLATPLPLERLCALAQVSRAGFYRWQCGQPVRESDLDLRDEMQRIAIEFPYYGRRRMTKELHARGWAVNHKRVLRLMREDNLLCLRRRKFVMTTDSNHPLPVYPNLARELELTGLNQLWVADITYIRLELEFVYLAVVLDAFSRRVIGCPRLWAALNFSIWRRSARSSASFRFAGRFTVPGTESAGIFVRCGPG